MRGHGLPEIVSSCLRRGARDYVLGEYYKYDEPILVIIVECIGYEFWDE
jgi:hypothetical protein